MPAQRDIHYKSVNIQTSRTVCRDIFQSMRMALWLAEQSFSFRAKYLETQLQLAFPYPVDTVSASPHSTTDLYPSKSMTLD